MWPDAAINMDLVKDFNQNFIFLTPRFPIGKFDNFASSRTNRIAIIFMDFYVGNPKLILLNYVLSEQCLLEGTKLSNLAIWNGGK